MNKLVGNYTFDIVEHKTFFKVFMEMKNELFKETFTIPVEDFLTKRELDFNKTFKHLDVFRLYVLVYSNDEIVGWHVGFQKGPSYYMMNTAVLEKYRRNGIYTALLNTIISITEKKGFHTITSRHNTNNNRVIIPKLKAGFQITGMEIEPMFGTLVNLTYFFNEAEKEIYTMRAGGLKPTDKMLKY